MPSPRSVSGKKSQSTAEHHLLIGIYFHPEAFPPTLNAIEQLSKIFANITVLCRPHLLSHWNYPQNVQLRPSGSQMSAKEQERASLIRKAWLFFLFTFQFLLQCFRRKPSWILVYDPISFYAYTLIRPFLFFKHQLWYHNHDVIEEASIKKFSIGWFAAKAEMKKFPLVDLFTLPSLERTQYFPMDKSWKGHFIHLPNFPSTTVYSQELSKQNHSSTTIKLVFQGKISESRGIEEVIALLGKKINGRTIELLLSGYCNPDYLDQLVRQVNTKGVTEYFHYTGEVPYSRLPEITKSCTIGLSIYSGNDIMNTTFITASNKLYEYAASGLPVLYLNRPSFVEPLKKYSWAFPVDLTEQSLLDAIRKIVDRYTDLSESAVNDFKTDLNFEKVFEPVRKFLQYHHYGK